MKKSKLPMIGEWLQIQYPMDDEISHVAKLIPADDSPETKSLEKLERHFREMFEASERQIAVLKQVWHEYQCSLAAAWSNSLWVENRIFSRFFSILASNFGPWSKSKSKQLIHGIDRPAWAVITHDQTGDSFVYTHAMSWSELDAAKGYSGVLELVKRDEFDSWCATRRAAEDAILSHLTNEKGQIVEAVELRRAA